MRSPSVLSAGIGSPCGVSRVGGHVWINSTGEVTHGQLNALDATNAAQPQERKVHHLRMGEYYPRRRGAGDDACHITYSMHLDLNNLALWGFALAYPRKSSPITSMIKKHCVKTGAHSWAFQLVQYFSTLTFWRPPSVFKFIRSITGELPLKLNVNANLYVSSSPILGARPGH